MSEKDCKEIWRDIQDHEGRHQVSDQGRIRSLDMNITRKTRCGNWNTYTKKGRILKCSFNAYGYKVTKLGRRSKDKFVHRLVLETFIGPCPKGMEGCHENGIRNDNRLNNLRWDTRKGNVEDQERHGTINRGSRHGKANLTEKQATKIRYLCECHWGTQKEIGRLFGISQSHVAHIKRRRLWDKSCP